MNRWGTSSYGPQDVGTAQARFPTRFDPRPMVEQWSGYRPAGAIIEASAHRETDGSPTALFTQTITYAFGPRPVPTAYCPGTLAGEPGIRAFIVHDLSPDIIVQATTTSTGTDPGYGSTNPAVWASPVIAVTGGPDLAALQNALSIPGDAVQAATQ